jgi:hypothetical protein
MFGISNNSIPRWVVEATFIIPAMILFPLFCSNHNIFLASIIEWMILYSISLIIWRIMFTFVFPIKLTYGIIDLIRPAYFIGLILIIAMFLGYVAPNYRSLGYIHLDSKEMAKNCKEAKWTLYIYYSYYHGHLSGTKILDLVGSQEEVEKMSKTYMERFFKNHSKYTYTDHTIFLYNLPEDLVHKNHWPDYMHEDHRKTL